MSPNEQHSETQTAEAVKLSELLACPFCGNHDLTEDYAEYDNSISYWIECPKCEIVVEGDTKREAYKKWNTRAN